MKTLIVEDDFTARLVLQQALSRHGECHIAVNGLEAVEAVRMAIEQGDPYNLVCMDVVMPEMDGPAAVWRIRAFEEARGIPPAARTRIVMTTIVEELGGAFQSFRQLWDGYMMKPVDIGELMGHLQGFGLI